MIKNRQKEANMFKKEDPRAVRTKEMFKQGTITLLQEGVPLEKLSIQKVATAAGLNRTTFYLHYEDMQDLLHKLMIEIVDELNIQVEMLMSREAMTEKAQLVKFLDYLYTQRHYLLVLFKQADFEQHLFEAVKRIISVRREHIVGMSNKKRIDIDIKTASLVGIMMWWLKSGLHHSSDYIATEIHHMYRS